MEVCAHVCTWATLCQEKIPCVYLVGGWISLRTDLVAIGMRVLCELLGIEL